MLVLLVPLTSLLTEFKNASPVQWDVTSATQMEHAMYVIILELPHFTVKTIPISLYANLYATLGSLMLQMETVLLARQDVLNVPALQYAHELLKGLYLIKQ